MLSSRITKHFGINIYRYKHIRYIHINIYTYVNIKICEYSNISISECVNVWTDPPPVENEHPPPVENEQTPTVEIKGLTPPMEKIVLGLDRPAGK